jgi:hypothetical protein
MKTKLLLVCVLCTFNLFAQTNLVSNGGFETWTNSTTLSNWSTENNVSQNTQYFSEGSNSAQLTIANSSTRPKILAQVPMSAGTTYTVKYKYKYLSSNYGGTHPISLNIEKAGSASYLSSNSFASNNDWTQKETTFTPDQNISYDFSISVTTFDSEGFEVLIDDVQVYIQGTEPTTLIPDSNFETYLISIGADSGPVDGMVLTSNISTVESLNLSFSSITNLTGIQDFIGLKTLYCNYVNITSLNLSKNILLEELYVKGCLLTSLDVSTNVALKHLACQGNKLTNLNLKNGNNTLLITSDLSFKNNSTLTCIQVDDVNYSTTNWASAKDAVATYKTNCSTLGLEDSVFEKVALYPNPTKDEVTITNIALEKITVYNTLGQLVKSFTFNSNNTNNKISLSGLPQGLYYVYLINKETASVKKVIVE